MIYLPCGIGPEYQPLSALDPGALFFWPGAALLCPIRKGCLDAFLHMRSQSAATVFPYDLFTFTMLHELVSESLSLPMGHFHYYSNSFHYYMEEQQTVDNILSDETVSDILPMARMDIANDIGLRFVMDIEHTIREQLSSNLIRSIKNDAKITDYWRELLLVLFYKACIEQGIKIDLPSLVYLKSASIYI